MAGSLANSLAAPPAGGLPDWPLLAQWRASVQAGQFDGHFPGQPILPGAWLLDAVAAQVEAACGRRVLAVREAKFLSAVPATPPGPLLRLHARLEPDLARFALMHGAALACAGALALQEGA